MDKDKALEVLAEDVDQFIVELGHTYKFPLLSVLAIILARVTVASKSFHLESDVSKILEQCQIQLLEKPEDSIVH